MFGTVLEYIGRTNLFNFVIFLSILIYLYRKIDVPALLEKSKNSIIEVIESSKAEKVNSESELKKIENTLEHLGEEIDEIIKKSAKNADLVGEKILSDADKTVNGIKDNSKKLIENRAALLKNDILNRASKASVEVAKEHIIAELNNNYDLHQRLIDESLDALESYKG